MKKRSAGILLYKFVNNNLQVLLVHPGGPYWKNKDENSWSIPKGEFQEDERAFDAALREFKEETGMELNSNKFIELSPVIQNSGKIVYAWAVEGDIDAQSIWSNLYEIEWPPKSGKMQKFPEVDKAEWFPIPIARKKILKKQYGLIEELINKLNLDKDKIKT